MRSRIATEEDLEQLMRMEALCFTDPWGELGIREELKPEDKELVPRVFIYEDINGEGIEAIAYLIGFAFEDEFQVYRVGVLPQYRNQGIAYRFLSEVLDYVKANGMSKSTLEARENNLPAIQLYKHLGFVEVGRRKNFYKDTGETAILMDLNF